MPPTIAITGASGKLGGATLSALLERDLVSSPQDVVALTSSAPGSPTWTALAARGVRVRHASFDDPASFDAALRGVDRLFLVSSPRIARDFDDAPEGQGREGHHYVAIDAALKTVSHLYYSSLAFAYEPGVGDGVGHRSKAGVMRAHLRTEAYVRDKVAAAGRPGGEGGLAAVTIIREGLYNESWPLYLGYFDPTGADARNVVKLAADGPVCWTAIKDLGIANAMIITAPSAAYAGRTLYLSTRAASSNARDLRAVAANVGRARGRDVAVELVGRAEHERAYTAPDSPGPDAAPAIRWWAGAYEALADGECRVDDPELETLLARAGVEPTRLEDTIGAMVKGPGGAR
ncbi:NAD(P)-binding protein [Xylariaceae sp. FL0804]|nr:NAD(P)-binding protein [Xylariaceae sp. FL0804]